MRPHADRLFLCGAPASGKTTIGRALARELGATFVDTDAAIVARTKQSIAQIFEDLGEPAFRALEVTALNESIAHARAVIALGGGTLLAAENRALVSRSGCSVYLRAQVATLERRLERHAVVRPLLATTRVGTLLDARRDVYEAADIIVDVDGRSPSDIVREIVRRA